MHLTPRCIPIFLAVALAAPALSQAAIVYENLPSDPFDGKPGGIIMGGEFGDQVTLAGSDRQITGFNLTLLKPFSPAKDSQITIKFFANDGPDVGAGSLAPGSLLYSTTVTDASRHGHPYPAYTPYEEYVLHIDLPGIVVPDTFTWSFKTDGYIYVRLAENPVVGSSDDFFWLNHAWDGTWVHASDPSNYVSNAAVSITTGAVPEPASLSLLALGGLLLLRRRRV